MIKQRFIHYYFLNEVIHLAFLFYLYITSTPIINIFIYYILFYYANFAALFVVLMLRRELRSETKPYLKEINAYYAQKHINVEKAKFKSFKIQARDGVTINVSVSVPSSSSSTSSKQNQTKARRKVMLLAEPLGQKGPSVYRALIHYFGDDFVYITWDYRGLFDSSSPSVPRRISIPQHAEDAIEVLKACGFEYADVIVGHSMGTAVALEACLLFPEKIKSQILLNGFHGHVFSTVSQPLVRFPLIGDIYAALLEYMVNHQSFAQLLRRGLSAAMSSWLPIYSKIFGSELMTRLDGEEYFQIFLRNYLGPLFENEKDTKSLKNYLRLFLELNAWSVYHLLPNIKIPTLLVSGLMDMLTPAMQSVEIARRIENAEHYCDPFSTHASILESPERCLAEIARFLDTHGVWCRSSSSAHHAKLE